MTKPVLPLIGRTLLFAALACALAAAPGCRRLKPSSAGLRVESYPQNKISMNARFFEGWFRVTSVSCARENELLRATVVAENLKSDCQVEYRYRWLDKDGLEITTGMTAWTPKACGSRETLLLTGIAPTARAEDFILDLRFAYKSTRF